MPEAWLALCAGVGGEGGAWVILKVPFDVEKRFGSKGRGLVSSDW
jgi:hypothetical protein